MLLKALIEFDRDTYERRKDWDKYAQRVFRDNDQFKSLIDQIMFEGTILQHVAKHKSQKHALFIARRFCFDKKESQRSVGKALGISAGMVSPDRLTAYI